MARAALAGAFRLAECVSQGELQMQGGVRWIWGLLAMAAPSVAFADVAPPGGGCGCATVSAALPPLVLLVAATGAFWRRR